MGNLLWAIRFLCAVTLCEKLLSVWCNWRLIRSDEPYALEHEEDHNVNHVPQHLFRGSGVYTQSYGDRKSSCRWERILFAPILDCCNIQTVILIIHKAT